ncbi:MAG: PQQ-binding-like beta-propeller repeat protein [Pirellulales bacterium]
MLKSFRVAMVWCALVSSVAAAPGDMLFKVTRPDSQPGEGFGAVVAAVDDDIIVSELFVRPFQNDAAGRAYLFDGQTGKLTFTFNNPQPQNNDSYAASLAGGDGRAFVGTTGVNGRVYAYGTVTGELLQTIPQPTPQNPAFGSALAYGEGRLLVSDPAFSGVPFIAQGIGEAYLFNAATGQLERPIRNPAPELGDLFGSGTSLAISGNRAIVGSILANDDAGRVWAFDRSSGNVLLTLENPNPESTFFDSFGFSVTANQDIIAVGAQEDSTSGVEGDGTVYVFDALSGSLRHTLFNPHSRVNAEFGRSIALTDDGNLLVGAFGNAGGGHAYLFDSVTGNLLLDIANPDPSTVGVFGFSVATIGNNMVVGAPGGTGAVYVLEAIPEPSSFALAGTVLFFAIAVLRRRALVRPS